MVEVSQRNSERIDDIPEPGFAGKITASVSFLIEIYIN
jgi:hypothetical protein